jgi:hypothetical protein
MDDKFKEIARTAESRLTESILRWKYRREGKTAPQGDLIKRRSEQVRDQAHRILHEKGKRVWEEIKKAYHRGEGSAE